MINNINKFPTELLEIIFIKLDYKTKLELVCKRWNAICKKNYMIKYRKPCICESSLNNKKCLSLKHKCICNISPEHTSRCLHNFHPCVCNKGYKYTEHCKSDSHPCVCLNSPFYAKHCKSNSHPCICHLGPYYMLSCNGYHD